ncbi:hypothetical protein EDC01DRAFT_630690 [Geopyxis carbonaria]|nr:hypothetical protein EDC01DRAFT_630690 [Geopyxis carbonaria]
MPSKNKSYASIAQLSKWKREHEIKKQAKRAMEEQERWILLERMGTGWDNPSAPKNSNEKAVFPKLDLRIALRKLEITNDSNLGPSHSTEASFDASLGISHVAKTSYWKQVPATQPGQYSSVCLVEIAVDENEQGNEGKTLDEEDELSQSYEEWD